MHLPPLIQDLATILGIAAIVTFLFKRIRQPVVLGYVVAGIIVGPYTENGLFISDTASIHTWAELGVIFLMFSLGLEFSFRQLARVGFSAVFTALIQLGVMIFFGVKTAHFLGLDGLDPIFLGCMIAISSTTIIIKALDELGMKAKNFAKLVLGILIVEDLAAVLMLVALTSMATTSKIGGLELLTAAAKLFVIVGLWFVVGTMLVPRFVKKVSEHGNEEMLTVVSCGLCLALVVIAGYFHYSAALGAFIMGSILADIPEARTIEHLVQPLKDIFGAVFFVSVGMLLDPQMIVDNYPAVLLISGVIIICKIGAVFAGALLTGQSLEDATMTGFGMAQIGEFSFIIASLGLSYQVMSPKLYPVIVAVSVVTTFTTPYLLKASVPTARGIERVLPQKVRQSLERYATKMKRQRFIRTK